MSAQTVEVTGLHVCPYCHGTLVYPLDWSEDGPWHWRITLRCPECERVGTGVFAQRSVERFDDELERGSQAFARDLRRATTEAMSDEADVLARALAADLITADDFA